MSNDAYPYSAVAVNDDRFCPVCDEMVAPDAYALHWRTRHPQADVEAMNAMNDVELERYLSDLAGAWLAPDVVLTEHEIAALALTWTETHDTFMDAIFDALRSKRDA